MLSGCAMSSIVKLDISMQLSLFSSSVMTDVVRSQNDILPVFLVYVKENMKLPLRLVLFSIML